MMKMKKVLYICLIAGLLLGFLTGCGSSKSEVDLSSFQTVDLAGNEVTQDIFKEYDVTMVNIWATWCKYCIEEMPALETVYQNLPENSNMITICMDADQEEEEAKRLVAETGVTFQVLMGNDELRKKVDENLSGYPTTVFLDKSGHLIGEPIVGAPAKNTAEVYSKSLEEALAAVKE